MAASRHVVAHRKVARLPKLGVADAHRVLQHGREHRRKLARRAGNDLQHLTRRGLLLQRFGEIVGALAQLVEQPRVLDGDDGLRGEVLDQLNLLFGEWRVLPAINDEGADQLIIVSSGTASRLRVPSSSIPATHTGRGLRTPDPASHRRRGRPPLSPRMRPSMLSGCGENGSCIIATSSGLAPRCAPIANFCPSQRYRNPKLASQMRTAFSSIDLEHRLEVARRRTDDLAAPRSSRSAAPAIR